MTRILLRLLIVGAPIALIAAGVCQLAAGNSVLGGFLLVGAAPSTAFLGHSIWA